KSKREANNAATGRQAPVVERSPNRFTPGCGTVSRPFHSDDRRSPAARETCGRNVRRGRETRAELCHRSTDRGTAKNAKSAKEAKNPARHLRVLCDLSGECSASCLQPSTFDLRL